MQPSNLALVALTPSDVPAQQQHLADWCWQKMQALGQEYRDYMENVTIAKKHKWRHTGIQRAALMAKRRIQYYAKLRAAVKLGFLVVPNFDVDVMAVRVQRAVPKFNVQSHDAASTRIAVPELLPVGAGRYVDDKARQEHRQWKTKDPQTAQITTHDRYQAIAFRDEIDFPVLAIKPVVMDATARAMAFKVFDRIGVVTGRKEDPVVIGQIIDPRSRNVNAWSKPERMTSFFIAWWLNTASL